MKNWGFINHHSDRLKNRALAAALFGTGFLAGCGGGPKTFVPGFTDSYDVHIADTYKQADALLQADYVFVMDYSASMKDKSAEIVDSMDEFAGYLEESDIDYRIGFVVGNIHSSEVWTISDDFMGPFLTSKERHLLSSQVAAQVEPIGADLNPNRPVPLEAALKTMRKQADGFLRPAAQLVYVFMSDNDDQSQAEYIKAANKKTEKYFDPAGNRSTDFYDKELSSFKIAPSYVSARSYTAGVADDCDIQNAGFAADGSDFVGDVPGLRLVETARKLDAISDFPADGDGCIYDPTSDLLKHIARNVVRPHDRFILRGAQMPGTVRVFVKPVGAQEEIEFLQDNDWTFNEETNELLFKPGRAPEPSAQLRIEYEMAYPLSETPQVESIEVSINGGIVPKSSVNGWSYVPEDNRIAFHGNARPPNGSEVKVSYQVRK